MVDDYNNRLDEWMIQTEHARSLILSTIPETLQIEIITAKSAYEAWSIVCTKYDNQSEMVQADIMGQMYQVRCTDDTDPHKTIQTLQSLQARYASARGKLEPAQFTAIILGAMPETYRPLVHSLVTANKAVN